MTKAKVNKDLCISCGACVGMVPDVFEFGDDDKAEVVAKEISEDLTDDVKDAAEGCPTDAIEVSEDK